MATAPPNDRWWETYNFVPGGGINSDEINQFYRDTAAFEHGAGQEGQFYFRPGGKGVSSILVGTKGGGREIYNPKIHGAAPDWNDPRWHFEATDAYKKMYAGQGWGDVNNAANWTPYLRDQWTQNLKQFSEPVYGQTTPEALSGGGFLSDMRRQAIEATNARNAYHGTAPFNYQYHPVGVAGQAPAAGGGAGVPPPAAATPKPGFAGVTPATGAPAGARPAIGPAAAGGGTPAFAGPAARPGFGSVQRQLGSTGRIQMQQAQRRGLATGFGIAQRGR